MKTTDGKWTGKGMPVLSLYFWMMFSGVPFSLPVAYAVIREPAREVRWNRMFCTSLCVFTKAARGGQHLNHLALELVLLIWKQWPLTLALILASCTSPRPSSYLVPWPTSRFLDGKTCTLYLWTVNLQLPVCILFSCNTNQLVQKLVPACPSFLKSYVTRSVKDWWTTLVLCFCVQLSSSAAWSEDCSFVMSLNRCVLVIQLQSCPPSCSNSREYFESNLDTSY